MTILVVPLRDGCRLARPGLQPTGITRRRDTDRVDGSATARASGAYRHVRDGADRALLPFDRLDSPPGVPRFDHEAIAGIVQVCEHHFLDIDAEAMRRIVMRDVDSPPGDLRFPDPPLRVVRRVCTGSVYCDPRVAQQVERLVRPRHAPEPELAFAHL